jgi:soluble lytic murein transglycosylase-like protein
MAATRASVSPQLIRSVTRQESAFRACAVSAKGAMGLMQLPPGTAGELGVTNAFDPEANVPGGARLLRQLMDRYGR